MSRTWKAVQSAGAVATEESAASVQTVDAAESADAVATEESAATVQVVDAAETAERAIGGQRLVA